MTSRAALVMKGQCGARRARGACALGAQRQATGDPILDAAHVSAVQKYGWAEGRERRAELDVPVGSWAKEHARDFGFDVLEWKAARCTAIEGA